NSEAILFTKYTYKYNDEGKNIEQKWFGDKQDLICTYTFKYDNNNNLIKKHYSYISNGGGKYIYRYKYDNSAKMIEQTFGRNSVLSKTTYVYDDNGNWIESHTTEGKNTKWWTERRIDYFE